MKVRRATEDDIPDIATIHVRSWQAAYRGVLPDPLLDRLSVAECERSWRALLTGGGSSSFTFVAEDTNGALVGFCSVATPSREARGEKTAEIGALYVDPDRWRERAGSGLLAAALEELRKSGWSEVTLWVLPENKRALAFYASFTFAVETGVEKIEERSGRPVVRLRARLS